MLLVGEPAGQRDLDDRHGPLQQSLGALDPQLHQSLVRRRAHRQFEAAGEVRRADEVDVVTPTLLQFQHHLRETFVRDFVFELLLMRLRDLVVLAVDATQVTVAEEDVARAARAGQRRFFAEMRSVRRDDRQAS